MILPGLLVGLLTAWPWLDRSPRGAAGLWFARSRRTQNFVFLAVCAGVVVLTIVGICPPRPLLAHLLALGSLAGEDPGRI